MDPTGHAKEGPGLGARSGSFRDQYVADKKRRAQQLRDPSNDAFNDSSDGDGIPLATPATNNHHVAAPSPATAAASAPATTDILAQIRELSKSIQENYAKVAASKISNGGLASAQQQQPYRPFTTTPFVSDASSAPTPLSPSRNGTSLATTSVGTPPSKVEEAFAALRNLLNSNESATRPVENAASPPRWLSSQSSPFPTTSGPFPTTSLPVPSSLEQLLAQEAVSVPATSLADNFMDDIAKMTQNVIRAASLHQTSQKTTAESTSVSTPTDRSVGAVQDALNSAAVRTASPHDDVRIGNAATTPDRFSPPLNRYPGDGHALLGDDRSASDEEDIAAQHSSVGLGHGATNAQTTDDADRTSEANDSDEEEVPPVATANRRGGSLLNSSNESFEPVVLGDDSAQPQAPHHRRVDTAPVVEDFHRGGGSFHNTDEEEDEDDEHVYNLGEFDEEEEAEEEPESDFDESDDGSVNDGVKTTVLFYSTEPQNYELMSSVGRWEFEEDADHAHLLEEVEAALQESLEQALEQEEEEFRNHMNKFCRTDGGGEGQLDGPEVTLEDLALREGGSATIKLALALLQKNVGISHREKQSSLQQLALAAGASKSVSLNVGAPPVVLSQCSFHNNSDALRAQALADQHPEDEGSHRPWSVSDLSLGRRYLVPSFPLGGGLSAIEHHKLRALFIALSSEIVRSQRARQSASLQRGVPSMEDEKFAQLNARAQALVHVVMKMASARLARRVGKEEVAGPTVTTTSEELLPFTSSIHINKNTFDRRRYFGEAVRCLTLVPAMLYAKSLEQALTTLGADAPPLSFSQSAQQEGGSEQLSFSSCVDLRTSLAVSSATHTPFDETILVKRQILDNWHHTALFEKFAPDVAATLVRGGEERMRTLRALLGHLNSSSAPQETSLLEGFLIPQLFHPGNIVVPPMSVSVDRSVVFSASKAKLTRREELEAAYRRDAKRRIKKQREVLDEAQQAEAAHHHSHHAMELAPVMREFPLKVVMNPFKTGFEDEKEVPLQPGMIIAGRYQLLDVLGQATFSRAVRCIDLQQKFVLKEKVTEDEEDEWVAVTLPLPDEPLALGDYTYAPPKPRRNRKSNHSSKRKTSPGEDADGSDAQPSSSSSSSETSSSDLDSNAEGSTSSDEDGGHDDSSKKKATVLPKTTTNPLQPDSYVQLCLKVINNSKEFFDQSLDEIRLLHLLNTRGDADALHFVRMHDYFYHREHTFILTELLSDNLYEYGKFVRDSKLPRYYTVSRVRSIARQLLKSLQFVHSLNLMHSDLKPENILFVSHSRCEIKVIDFGSSCFTSDHLSSYVQSRSYRAPEVILGADYDGRIDVWSVGAILAELVTQEVLFQSETAAEMLARIVAVCGTPIPRSMLYEGRYSSRFVDRFGCIYEVGERADTHGEDCYYLYTPVHRHSTRYITDVDGAATGGNRSPTKQSSSTSLENSSKARSPTTANEQHQQPLLDVVGDLPAPHVMLCSTVEPYSRLRRKLAAEGVDPRSHFADFVAQCLTIDHKRRPTCDELLQHPFLHEDDDPEEDARMTGMAPQHSPYSGKGPDPVDDEEYEECEGAAEEEPGEDEEDVEPVVDDDDEGEGANISKRLDDDYNEEEE